MDLKGRSVMIVGASRGIGRAAAQLFAEAGADLILTARSGEQLRELEDELELGKIAGRVFTCVADATDPNSIADLVDDTLQRFNSIDVLVYAAGAGVLKSFSEISLDEFDKQINVNVRGAFITLQAVLPVMERQKSGHVVALPGILGRAPMAQAAAYSASKYALTGMLKCLALEYKRAGVRFSLLHLGGVNSSFWDTITMRVQRDRMLTVEQAARAVFFAATQEGDGVLNELVLQPESHQMM